MEEHKQALTTASQSDGTSRRNLGGEGWVLFNIPIFKDYKKAVAAAKESRGTLKVNPGGEGWVLSDIPDFKDYQRALTAACETGATFFKDYEQALTAACETGATLKANPEEGGWALPNTPEGIKPLNKKREPAEDYPIEDIISGETTDIQKVYDSHNGSWEISEEKIDFADSMQRSEEDGWFYDKTDGDWENNLIDPESQ
jgi:hypothetical protein